MTTGHRPIRTRKCRKNPVRPGLCFSTRCEKGNGHPDITPLLEWYDGAFRKLLKLAEENYREVSWYVFTDHGMHNVTESYDLQTDLQAIGLEENRDFVVFYDATMARIWILNEGARDPIMDCLGNHPKGRILPDTELKELGVWFEDGQYGNLVFLMNPGIQIVPGYMGHACTGMHGYHPSEPDSYASITSNKMMPLDITNIQHIHRLMLDELNFS